MVHFIEYNPTAPSPAVPNKRWLKPSLRIPKVLKSGKFWLAGIVAVAALSVGVYFGLIRPAQDVLAAVNEIKTASQPLGKSFENQDIRSLDGQLRDLEEKFTTLRQKVEYFGFTEYLPWLGDYYRDSRHLTLAAQYGLEVGDELVQSLLPFADEISFESGKSATTEQKIQSLLPILPQIAPATEKISAKLNLVRQELTSVNPSRYPTEFNGFKPRESLQKAKELVDAIDEFMPQAKEVLLVLPPALGSPSPKNYFVLFQNDKELRPTGGFLTAYTYMTVNKGKVTTTGSENILKIDNAMRRNFTIPTPIAKYLHLVPYWAPRDANLSPDFLISMKKFEELAAYSSEYRKGDGIIAVDTFLLQDLLRLTGPVQVVGDTFTPENVVEKLELYAERVFKGRDNNKAFLGDMMKQVLGKLMSAGKDKWIPIIETSIKNGNEKHFLLFSRDQATQNLIEKYNWGGRIKDYANDYLHINDTNFAGAKANLYVTQKIMQDITIDGDGTVTKKVTVEVTNPAKYDGWLNGPYRDWIRMYVPKGSEFIGAEGGEVKTLVTGDELGKTMFESFFTARPLGTSSTNKATWSVTYKLPFKITGREIRILQQKQPGVDGPEVMIIVNGQVKVSEQLLTDKEFTLSF